MAALAKTIRRKREVFANIPVKAPRGFNVFLPEIRSGWKSPDAAQDILGACHTTCSCSSCRGFIKVAENLLMLAAKLW